MSLSKKIKGEKFYLSRQFETKAKARKGARLSRKSGSKARIFKLPKVFGVRPSRPWGVYEGGSLKRKSKR